MNFDPLPGLPARAAALAWGCCRHPAMLLHLPRVARNRRNRRTPLYDGLPWISIPAIAWLEQTIRPEWQAFEYGAGGSTVFLLQRLARVVSVEHDGEWLASVRERLSPETATRADLRHAPPQPGDDPATASTVPAYRGMNFRNYVSMIDEFADATFDLVLVDGRARNACVRAAWPKVRPGGWLVLDNSERPKYRDALAHLAPHPRHDFPGLSPYQYDPTRTSAWQKPAQP
ncbi:MAG: class I SAM-dependent methyltransferase [Candidatus Sumerlaeia bacterium]|nr:class I SAM-dependent methyltransferase [Candidatus Sumerlaeia bacterium]